MDALILNALHEQTEKRRRLDDSSSLRETKGEDESDIYHESGDVDDTPLAGYVEFDTLLPLPAIESIGVDDTTTTWDSAMDDLVNHFKQCHIREKQQSVVRSRLVDIDRELHFTPAADGSARDKRIRATLDQMGLVRSAQQIQFHNMILSGCSRAIYGADFDRCQDEIIAQNGGDPDVKPWILIQMPRRFGKTTGVGMIAADLAAHIPGYKIGIFSAVHRSSKTMMAAVYRFLLKIPGFNPTRIIKHNHEELQIASVAATSRKRKSEGVVHSPETVSVVYCYPASVRGTRGFTVDLTIAEEAAAMPPEVWQYSIVPALGTEGMTLVAITTAQAATGFFSLLMNRKGKDGRPVFATMAVGLICDACLANGVMSECIHKLALLPAWKGPERQALIKAILGKEGEDIFRQEALGEVLEDRNQLFNEASIMRFFASAGKTPASGKPPHIVWSYIDPSGGGTQSSQAIVDIIDEGDNCFVCTLYHCVV